MDTSLVESFINDGFVRIDNAFPRGTAVAGRQLLWAATGCDPDDPKTWARPVVRLGDHAEPPFAEAVNTPILHDAYDQLVGAGRWLPRASLGTFPIRFPWPDDPGDTGWHIDASFTLDTDDPRDIFAWRINVTSRGRALLMLFLFSDVSDRDAPTRIRVGSHVQIARQLAPAGENGMSLRTLATDGFAASADCREVLATGPAGTVYLCHPFLVHAAQPHRGSQPRFMAQPPLHPRVPITLDRPDGAYSPVENAIRRALR